MNQVLLRLRKREINTVNPRWQLTVVQVEPPTHVRRIELRSCCAHVLATEVHRGVSEWLAIEVDSDRLATAAQVGRVNPTGDRQPTRGIGVHVLLIATQSLAANIFRRWRDGLERRIVTAQLFIEILNTGEAIAQVVAKPGG